LLSDIDPQSLWKRYSDSKIIQIYGSAGSGKSTLAMHFAKYILTKTNGKIFWIETERKLSKKRLYEILGQNINSIFITQPSSYQEQYKMIKTVTSMGFSITALIIDTISRHFRSLDSKNDWNSYSKSLQGFYENHILPLLVFQEKTGCYLILVHQVTTVPDVGDKPFMFKVFEAISSEWIYLG